MPRLERIEARSLVGDEAAPHLSVPILPGDLQRRRTSLEQIETQLQVRGSRESQALAMREIEDVIGLRELEVLEQSKRLAGGKRGRMIDILIAPRPQADNFGQCCGGDPGILLR